MAESSLYQPYKGTIRVTSLISPPAIRYYQLHRWDDICVDVDEFIYSGFGTAWHQYLSKFSNEQSACEQTLQMSHGGMIVSGTPDIRNANGDIDDYKVTSAWSFVFSKPEWEQQLNVYALLSELNGFNIKALHINAFLRDWSALNYLRYKPEYPERPFYYTTLPLWNIDKRKQFVSDRIADHAAGLRPCNPTERWQRPTTWAVMKGNAQKAARVLDTEEEAQGWIASKANGNLYHIECRPGSCRRCEEYCCVRSVCEFRTSNGYE